MKEVKKTVKKEPTETVVMKTVKKVISASLKSSPQLPEKKSEGVKKSSPKKKTVSSKPAEELVVKKRVRKLKIDRKLKMTKGQQRHYRELLQKLRDEYASQMEFHQNEALLTKKDGNGERAGTATHLADLGSDTFRRDIQLSMLNDESDVVRMIDIALKKLENSEYGICAECGCAIPPARLEAKPYALFCTACKEKMENGDGPLKNHR